MEISKAARDILDERQRQIDESCWTTDHDDEHIYDEIAYASASYILPGQHPQRGDWSWKHKHPDSPKRVSRRQQLVIGAALALAEIERIDRVEQYENELSQGESK